MGPTICDNAADSIARAHQENPTMSMSAPTVNRRSAPRRQATLGTICRLSAASAKAVRLGLVWNLSSSGVSMLIDEAPETGTVVSAVLATVDETRSLPVTLRIVHVRAIRTGDYFLGAQFDRPLEPGEMRPFLAEPDAGS
jgi:hypothetical protein